jgi:hypothetical protein
MTEKNKEKQKPIKPTVADDIVTNSIILSNLLLSLLSFYIGFEFAESTPSIFIRPLIFNSYLIGSTVLFETGSVNVFSNETSRIFLCINIMLIKAGTNFWSTANIY